MDSQDRKIALAAAVVNDLTARPSVHDNTFGIVPVFSNGGFTTTHAPESHSL